MCLTASEETIYLIYVENYFDKNQETEIVLARRRS